MTLGRVAIVAVVALGMVVPTGAALQPAEGQDAVGTATTHAAATGAGAATAAAGAPVAAANNSSVNVTVGRQLSTVLAATETEVGADLEEERLAVVLETGTESEKAEALADRAAELRERARDVRETYREATRAYDRGELSRSAYAQQLAVLNARARTIVESYERLIERAENVSGFELAAAGLNRTALREAVASIENATGPGASALLLRFTGQREGEVEIERADGLTIEVAGEDGERSREVERPRDDDGAMTVDQAAALATARAALSDQPGNWTLVRSTVHPASGYYRFSFALRTNATTGTAEVRVDGSSGEVFRLEEELEPRDDERDEEDDETDDGGVDELTLLVAEGTPAPGATVTVQARADGEAVPNATVLVDGAPVGATGSDGTLAVTLANGSTTVVARAGDEDAELEFEFERDDEDHEREGVVRQIDAGATLDGDTVSLSVTYDGSGVANVTVYADDERVGETGADGTLSFATTATEELELELVKGELEVELEYCIVNGSLVLEEDAREGDGDKVEDGDDADGTDDEADGEDDDDADDDDADDGTETEDEDTETEDDD